MLNKAQTRFIGLSNFTYLLSRDAFWMVVQQSAIFALSAVFFKALIGLITAHLINNLPTRASANGAASAGAVGDPAGIVLARMCGCLIPPFAFNWLLLSMGFQEIAWLSNPYWARFSVILSMSGTARRFS